MMLKGFLTFAILASASGASACLQAQPDYVYTLSGKVSLQENGVIYTACEVKDGYLTLKANENFRLQSLVIECNERMLGHNSSLLTLKNGKVNPEQDGYKGTYDTHSLEVAVKKSDEDGTYEENDKISFAEKCESVVLDVKMKKAGKVTYNGHFSGTLQAKKTSR